MRGLVLVVALLAAALVRAEPQAAQQGLPQQPAHTNRLAKETSPYLLLHAHNPVDWYPWGDEALAKAKREKKLIFLSIGYSSCYWCHVMERESFWTTEIAERLNEHFVCIKVDREERPDLDEIYMPALRVYMQLIGSKQGGGWPLSMFLTPDAKPLVGGTYFPPRDVDGRLGFLTVLDRVREAWSSDAEKWQKTGDSLADYVAESLRQRPILQRGEARSAAGGLGPASAGHPIRHGSRRVLVSIRRVPIERSSPSRQTCIFCSTTLGGTIRTQPARWLMRRSARVSLGGIHDHIGGGFHRYSTDRFWRVPHFEKMLYDNAQLRGFMPRHTSCSRARISNAPPKRRWNSCCARWLTMVAVSIRQSTRKPIPRKVAITYGLVTKSNLYSRRTSTSCSPPCMVSMANRTSKSDTSPCSLARSRRRRKHEEPAKRNWTGSCGPSAQSYWPLAASVPIH